ncbi:MAG TPA: hypothetical protein VF550_17565 [Polyangia bacterium]
MVAKRPTARRKPPGVVEPPACGRFDLGGKLLLAGHSKSIVAPAGMHAGIPERPR